MPTYRRWVAGCILAAATAVHGAGVYQHDFGTTTISGKPYTVAPTVRDTHIQAGSQWDTSYSAFTSYAGSSGQALALSNSSGTPTCTLTLTLDAGHGFTLDTFSFWRQRSTTGAQNWSMTVNGIAVGSGAVPTIGAGTGLLVPTSPVSGIEGTVTVVLTLSGASGSGTFRLDDFTLEGVIEAAGPDVPTVAITVPAAEAIAVDGDVAAYEIAGTAANAVGWLRWTNTLTQAGGAVPVGANWSIPGLALGCR